MNQSIAIVMSEVFLRRLTPALSAFSGPKRNYRILSVHRPIVEVEKLLDEINPVGLISEWLPEKADDLRGLALKIPHGWSERTIDTQG